MIRSKDICRECRQLACACDMKPIFEPTEKLVCRRCGHAEYFTQPKGKHLGAYCCACQAWIKWLRQDKPAIVVVQDTREQNPLDLARYGLIVVREKLDYGDYSIKSPNLVDKVCIERKSIDDFAMCCGKERDRFERELMAMQAYPIRFIVCEFGLKDVLGKAYRSQINPESVTGSMARWAVLYGVVPLFCESPDGASYMVAKLLKKIATDPRWDVIFNAVANHGLDIVSEAIDLSKAAELQKAR